VVRLLLNPDYEVNINKVDPHERTPFYAACLNGHVEIVKMFLECGRFVDINYSSQRSGKTPLYAASVNGHALARFALES